MMSNNLAQVLNEIPQNFQLSILCPQEAYDVIRDFRDSLNFQDTSISNLRRIHEGLHHIADFTERLTQASVEFQHANPHILHGAHTLRYFHLWKYYRLVNQIQNIVTRFDNRVYAGHIFRATRRTSWGPYNRHCIGILAQRARLVRGSRILLAVMRRSENIIGRNNINFPFIPTQWSETM